MYNPYPSEYSVTTVDRESDATQELIKLAHTSGSNPEVFLATSYETIDDETRYSPYTAKTADRADDVVIMVKYVIPNQYPTTGVVEKIGTTMENHDAEKREKERHHALLEANKELEQLQAQQEALKTRIQTLMGK